MTTSSERLAVLRFCAYALFWWSVATFFGALPGAVAATLPPIIGAVLAPETSGDLAFLIAEIKLYTR